MLRNFAQNLKSLQRILSKIYLQKVILSKRIFKSSFYNNLISNVFATNRESLCLEEWVAQISKRCIICSQREPHAWSSMLMEDEVITYDKVCDKAL